MLTISELEKKLKEFLKAEHVTVLSVNGKPYSRFKMGYAVTIVKHNKTGEYVPMLLRMNVYSGSVTSVMLLERDILHNLRHGRRGPGIGVRGATPAIRAVLQVQDNPPVADRHLGAKAGHGLG